MPVTTVMTNKVVLMITTYMYGVVGSPIPSGCRTRPSTPLTCERIFWATWPRRCPRPGTLITAAEVSVLLEHGGTCPCWGLLYNLWVLVCWGFRCQKVSKWTCFWTALDQRLLNTTEHTTQQNSHERDVTMSMVASQITGVSIVYTTVCSGADQWKKSPHIGPVTRKMFPFEDVIMHVNSVLLEHHMMA